MTTTNNTKHSELIRETYIIARRYDRLCSENPTDEREIASVGLELQTALKTLRRYEQRHGLETT